MRRLLELASLKIEGVVVVSVISLMYLGMLTAVRESVRDSTYAWAGKCSAKTLVLLKDEYHLHLSCEDGRDVVWDDAASMVRFAKNEPTPILLCKMSKSSKISCKAIAAN